MMTSCLRVPGGRDVPLRGVEVEGDVFGGHAHVRVRQRYQNDERKPVEAIYTFPLPSDGTLVGFSMTCDGRKIEGVVKEREEAFASYDDAVHDGHGAALLEQERPNVFTASVGNLLPGEETLIEICYVQKVQADEGALRVMIPTLVAPRYIPGTPSGDRTADGREAPTNRVPDADRITPKIGEVDYGLKLTLTFDLGQNVEVESPSHELSLAREGGKVRASLRRGDVALDRDVVVTARGVDKGPMKTVALHRDGDEGIVALTVVPDLGGGGEPPRQDVVFVVDTSGSMAGDSIGQAQAALRLCLRHLREGDRFNLIRFSSGHKALFRETKPFTQRMLDEADDWARNLIADGGTEMLAPLLEAIDQVPDGVVVLLTDGQVGNESEILQAALAKRKTARIYTFGIGTNVSDALLRDLAKQSGGAAEFIHPGERIDEKVVAQFARATARRVTDVAVSWKGIEASELAPNELLPIVDNEPWTLYGRVRGRTGEAEIRGKLDGKPFYLAVPLDLERAKAEPLLGKLWASERVRDLGVEGLTGRRADRMKGRIVELGVKYGIATPFTSFVAIETRTGDRRASGYPETRVVPVNAPAGWDMMKQPRRAKVTGQFLSLGVTAFGRPPAMGRAPAAPMPMMADAPPPAVTAKGGGGLVGAVKAFFGGGGDALSMNEDRYAGIAREDATPSDPITPILQAQLASGLWGPADARDAVLAAETAAAMWKLLDAGVRATHPVHGALVKKAVRAALALARRVKGDAAELLRSLAWLLSEGKRDRAAIAAELPAPPDDVRLIARVHELLAVVHPH